MNGIPKDARAQRASSFNQRLLSDEIIEKVRALNEIAAARGQSRAQMAIAWGQNKSSPKSYAKGERNENLCDPP